MRHLAWVSYRLNVHSMMVIVGMQKIWYIEKQLEKCFYLLKCNYVFMTFVFSHGL